jgi:hypothetical protein
MDAIDARMATILAESSRIMEMSKQARIARDWRGLADLSDALRANNAALADVTHQKYPSFFGS